MDPLANRDTRSVRPRGGCTTTRPLAAAAATPVLVGTVDPTAPTALVNPPGAQLIRVRRTPMETKRPTNPRPV